MLNNHITTKDATNPKYRNGYNTPELRAKMRDALNDYTCRIMDGEPVQVSISMGNRKTGIPSISVLPIITCPAACRGTCDGKCYAAKGCTIHNTELKAYARNTAIFFADPEKYFDAVKKACRNTRFFRYHVAGDIINSLYFSYMVKTATECPDTIFLAFTKRYNVVNNFIAAGGIIPDNLKIIFSGWNNLQPDNPYNLPETTVYAKHTKPEPEWLLCGGNCLECACRGVGCWQLGNGQKLAFEIH